MNITCLKCGKEYRPHILSGICDECIDTLLHRPYGPGEVLHVSSHEVCHDYEAIRDAVEGVRLSLERLTNVLESIEARKLLGDGK